MATPLAEANSMRGFMPKELHSPHFESHPKALGQTTEILLWLFLHNKLEPVLSLPEPCARCKTQLELTIERLNKFMRELRDDQVVQEDD